jgi:ABC-2 type transport system permease protein
MSRFFAVVKHEYKKVVLRWAFVISTLLFPVLAACFAFVPAIIFSLQSEPSRIVIVDESGKSAPRLKAALSPETLKKKAAEKMGSMSENLNATQQEKLQAAAVAAGSPFTVVDYDAAGKSPEQIKPELNQKIAANEIEAYLIIPADINSAESKYEFYSRKAGDFVGNSSLEDALNAAVRSQRLADANIDESRLAELSKNVNFVASGITEKGEAKDAGSSFAAGFIIGLMIYITLTIYGQTIMGAVIEEKETRIAEILFSSARPLELLAGKLVGVGLAGLTQLSIWVVSAAIGAAVVFSQLGEMGIDLGAPAISPGLIVYLLIFFLLGFFMYASIFALIGSMVTSMQEGSQFAFPPVMLLLVGFYFSFAVVRDPNSTVSFWASIAPLIAPITMPVRMLAEMPPFWQIALSIAVNAATIFILVWVASRVYRVGMLMYGKRATLPEVWKWIRQA